MSRIKRVPRWILALMVVSALALFLLPALLYAQPTLRYVPQTTWCYLSQPEMMSKIDCWFTVLEESTENEGSDTSMVLFQNIVDWYYEPVFKKTGCEPAVHFLGDVAFYHIYQADGDLDNIQLPDSLITCGEGFFHGFMEHLVQADPEPSHIPPICDEFERKFKDQIPVIRDACFHGAGHGLMSAQMGRNLDADAVTFDEFVPRPLRDCDSITGISDNDRKHCWYGAFHFYSIMLERGDLGVVFDAETLVHNCSSLPERWHQSCFFSISNKIGPRIDFSIKRLGEIADATGLAGTDRYEFLRFGIQGMTEGLVQKYGPEQVYRDCSDLSTELALLCMRGIERYLLNGDIRAGSTDPAIAFCDDLPADDSHGMKNQCFITLTHELWRLYTPERREKYCARLPEIYQGSCRTGR